MKLIKTLLHTFLLLFIVANTFGQEYSYVHYEVRDGLAGSTVYDMCQDKDGFMWFATENGVSRYDGTNFKNFTSKEGLTDIEVLRIYGDKKGRVWMTPFSKSICYYYEGKIYNKDNDSILKKIRFNSKLSFLEEDESGNIMMIDNSKIYLLKSSGELKEAADLKLMLSGNKFQNVLFASANPSGDGFILNIGQNLYLLKNDTLIFQNVFKAPLNLRLYNYKSLVTNKPINFLLKFNLFSFKPTRGHYDYVNTDNGSLEIDNYTGGGVKEIFLKGKKITRTIEDTEGNLWFSTIGDGVFRLPSRQFKTFGALNDNTANSEIFSLDKFNGSIIAGVFNSKAYLLKKDKIKALDFSKYLPLSKNSYQLNRLTTLKNISDTEEILGFDAFLIKLSAEKNVYVSPISPIKSVDKINQHQIVVATAFGVNRLNSDDLSVIDTIWHERATKVLYHNKEFYIGTISGLYKVDFNKKVAYLGELHPSLRKRITDIKVDSDGIVWIATNDRGVVGIKDGMVKKTFDLTNGLSSEICKSLFIDNEVLWVGTANGLNKIRLKDRQSIPTIFDVADGLPSSNINAIYVSDSIVYLGSPGGLSYFNQYSIAGNSRCDLKILSIKSSGKDFELNNRKILAHSNNNISFEYVAISFKSAGEITYRYQLEGLDTTWKETDLTITSFPTLPYGRYIFRLKATNKFGVESAPYKFVFTIQTPWWETAWFWILMFLLLVASLWYLINLRYKILDKRRDEKLDFRQRIADLEQLALRAQMNPHFIFNCLNSIQSFIINQDIIATNKYMNSFSRLLRQTLNHSSRKVLSIAEEITYISTYLELEKMRFGNKFTCKINIDENIPADFTFMPTMILQPFVENCIRHGILYRKDESGLVAINFSETADALIITIKDNGIGRKKSYESKTAQHIEYHSKGTELTFKRLELLSGNGKESVVTTITDLDEQNTLYPGTMVEIIFPLSIIDKLNKQR